MLTLARLAAAMTDRKRSCTLGGIARPSEKNTMLLRPGSARMPVTTDISALALA